MEKNEKFWEFFFQNIFFEKSSNFGLFWDFENFNGIFFLSFLVFHPKKHFFGIRNILLFSQKNFGSNSIIASFENHKSCNPKKVRLAGMGDKIYMWFMPEIFNMQREMDEKLDRTSIWCHNWPKCWKDFVEYECTSFKSKLKFQV